MAARLVEVARLTTHALAQHFRRYTHGGGVMGGGQAVVYTRWITTNSSGGVRRVKAGGVKARSNHVGGQPRAGGKVEKKYSKKTVRRSVSATSAPSLLTTGHKLTNKLTNKLTPPSTKLLNPSSTTVTAAQPKQPHQVFLEPLKPKLGEGEPLKYDVGLNAISSRGVERRTILGFDARAVRSPQGVLHTYLSHRGFPNAAPTVTFTVTPPLVVTSKLVPEVSRQLQHQQHMSTSRGCYGPSKNKKSGKGKRKSKKQSRSKTYSPDNLSKYPHAVGDPKSSFPNKMKILNRFFPMSDTTNNSDPSVVREHPMGKYDKSEVTNNSKKTSWAFVLKDHEPPILGPETTEAAITATSEPPRNPRGQVRPKGHEESITESGQGKGHEAVRGEGQASVGRLVQKTWQEISRYPGQIMEVFRQTPTVNVSKLKPEVVNKPKTAPEVNIKEHVTLRPSNEPKLTVSKNEIIARKPSDPSKEKRPANSASPHTPANDFFDIYQGSNTPFESTRARIKAAIERDNHSGVPKAEDLHRPAPKNDQGDLGIIERWSQRLMREDQAYRKARADIWEESIQSKIDREMEWKKREAEKVKALRKKHDDTLMRMSGFPPGVGGGVKTNTQHNTKMNTQLNTKQNTKQNTKLNTSRNLNEAEMHEALELNPKRGVTMTTTTPKESADYSSLGLSQRDQQLIQEIRNMWTTKFKKNANNGAPTPQTSASFTIKERTRNTAKDPKSVSKSQSSGRLYDILDAQSGSKPPPSKPPKSGPSKRPSSGDRPRYNTPWVHQDSKVYPDTQTDSGYRSDKPSANPNSKPKANFKPTATSCKPSTNKKSATFLDDDILSASYASHVTHDDGMMMRSQLPGKAPEPRKNLRDTNVGFKTSGPPVPVPGRTEARSPFDIAKNFFDDVHATYTRSNRQIPSNGKSPGKGDIFTESDTTDVSVTAPKTCKQGTCKPSNQCSKSPPSKLTKSVDCLNMKYDAYLNEYVAVQNVVEATRKGGVYPRYLDQAPFPLHTPRVAPCTDVVGEIQRMLRDGPTLELSSRQQRQQKMVDLYKKLITKHRRWLKVNEDKLRQLEARQRSKDKHLEF